VSLSSSLSVLFALLLVLIPGVSVQAEILHYVASYKGPFSAGENWAIADVKLDSKPLQLPALGKVTQITMEATSESYPFVEEHFPFRVRYQSIYVPDEQHVLALEKYQKTSRLKHEINWVDIEQGKLLRFRSKGKNAGKQPFPTALQQWLEPGERFEFHKYSPSGFEAGLHDRLSMLQMIRQQPLATGREYVFSVTDGKHRYRYVVRVENRHKIKIGKKQHLAWKLRFDAMDVRKRKAAHRPVYVWLADDAQHTPLLFENRHFLGSFMVTLVSEI